MKTAIAFLVLTTGLVAADTDNWQRSKECAEQAEKLAKRGSMSIDQIHYSPKYERCYAKLNEVDSVGINWYLYDVFEETWLARHLLLHAPLKNGEDNACFINEERKDCAVVDGYIAEH